MNWTTKNARKYFYKHDSMISIEITHGQFLETIKKCNNFLYDFIIETDQEVKGNWNILNFYINIRSKQ